MTTQKRLRAPFPYYGGKGRVAEIVWQKFGTVRNYVEPFAGSLAILLSNPNPAQRETVADTHAAVVNFWRAVQRDPEAVAEHATWPTLHHDLTARHRWLVRWFSENHERFSNDPDFFSAKAAGWWCWGLSLWIGGNFCDYDSGSNARSDQRSYVDGLSNGQGQGINARSDARRSANVRIPISAYVKGEVKGQGVSAQRTHFPDSRPHVDAPAQDQRPFANKWSAQGISAQGTLDQRPFQRNKGQGKGQGVSAQRTHFPDSRPHIHDESGAMGVSAQGSLDQRPQIPVGNSEHGGQYINAQSKLDKRPQIPVGNSEHGGQYINAQSKLDKRPQVRDQRPHVRTVNDSGYDSTNSGQGINAQQRKFPDQRPFSQPVHSYATGQGVNAQRKWVSASKRPTDGMPRITPEPGGAKISAQARKVTKDGRPYQADMPSGRGINAQTTAEFPTTRPYQNDQFATARGTAAQGVMHYARAAVRGEIGETAAHRQRVTEWMQALADRLFRVVVLNRDWTSLVTPTVLGDTEEARKRGGQTAVFLDPPYPTERRSNSLYASDIAGTSDDAAAAAYEWAVANGERMRIAYCCHDGDFPPPPGWTVDTRSFRHRSRAAKETNKQDCIMFSPACLGDRQGSLL